jgi:MFS transporter, DHA1 family, multidrug resistance protein
LTSASSGVWLGKLGDRIGHVRVLVAAALSAMVISGLQATVTTALQLGMLQALLGFALGGMVPSIAALMNLWSPRGNQGATYGLDTSVNAAARSIAPLVGAVIATSIGLRGVFGASAVIYGGVALLTIHVARKAQQRALLPTPAPKPIGDD